MKTKNEELLKGLPIEEVSYVLRPDIMFYVQYGSTLKEIGYVRTRDKIEYNIPVS